ncbi:MAG TPA: hypothetical protein VK911_00065 [Vicinamibacterales bacterium]|nr:hypothetical protein [Vicinamibacterales bacterium]
MNLTALRPAVLTVAVLAASSFGGAALAAEAPVPVPPRHAQGPGESAETLTAARALYGGAAYQDALDLLVRLKAAGPPAAEALEIDKYRAFCLLALGRTGEARQVFLEILIARPDFRLGQSEVSRRVYDTFREVRRESLPGTLTRVFQQGRQAYNYQLWDDAARAFERVIELSADADLAADAPHAGDLRELSRGYLDLLTVRRPALRARSLSGTARLPTAIQDVFGESDPEVTPPEPIAQKLPPWPAVLAKVRATGVLELVIDESGRVESAMMRAPVHPFYDAMLLDAVKGWRYRPARLGARAVKYRYRIQVQNTPQAPDQQPPGPQSP